jgi:hypothetical protein
MLPREAGSSCLGDPASTGTLLAVTQGADPVADPADIVNIQASVRLEGRTRAEIAFENVTVPAGSR